MANPVGPAHLPVLVFTTDGLGKHVKETGQVIDASKSGARLSWVGSLKYVGQIAELEYQGRRAKFRVAWVGEQGSKNQGHVGVESLEPGKDIWGFPPTEWNRQDAVAALPAMQPGQGGAVAVARSWSGIDRRSAKRVSCKGGAEFRELGGKVRNSAMVSDISIGGCYIETRATFPVETRLEFGLRINEFQTSGTAEVRVCHPGMGMGVAFREMTPQNREQLENIIEALCPGARAQRAATPPGGVKTGQTMDLLLFLVDTLKGKGLLTDSERNNAVARAKKKKL